MKKILYTIIFAGLLLFTGCDLERLPFNGYTEETIKNDPEGTFEILLNGCYGQMKDWSDVMHRVGEYAGDNMMIRGSSTDAFYDFISYGHRPSNYRLNTFWNNSYKIIAQTSDLMKVFDTPPSAEVAHQIGEAYYLRGTMYFYLCRAFGRPYYQTPETNMGVPIINGRPENILIDNISLPDRASVKETYTQAIADLRKAESLMSVEKEAIFATKEAAQAMLSRIYLYMSGTYESPNTAYADSAIYYANLVIASGRYELLLRNDFMKYNELIPEENKETIFAVKRVDAEFPAVDWAYYYGIGGMYSHIDGMGWGEMYASSKYIDRLRASGNGNPANDARWNFIRPQYTTDANGNKTPAFRFIKETYNASGVQTAYDYIQQPLQQEADNSYYITINSVKYPLTPVDIPNNRYSINYQPDNGPAVQTYVGDMDYMMTLNRAYPMFYIYKCSLEDGYSQLHSPIISRLGEMYLNLAEAYAKKGDYANALINLNIIRNRAVVNGGYPAGYLTAANAADVIDNERALELAYEAHRSFDVYRIGKTMVRQYPGPHKALENIPATDSRVVQLIPQDAINAYFGTLTQNP